VAAAYDYPCLCPGRAREYHPALALHPGRLSRLQLDGSLKLHTFRKTPEPEPHSRDVGRCRCHRRLV
jgi:hypothetical protein